MSPSRQRLQADLGLLLVVTLWGHNFIFTKLGLSSLTPLSFATLRTALALLVLVTLLLITRERLGEAAQSQRERLAVIGLGLAGNALFPLCYTAGLAYTSAANGALIIAASPVAVAAVSAVLGLERPTPRTWLGTVLSFVGIALVVIESLGDVAATWRGDLLMLVAMLAWVGYTVGCRPLLRRASSLAVTAHTTVWGTLALLLIGIPALAATPWPAVTPLSWTAVVYAGVLSTGFAYLLWNRSVRLAGPSRTAIFINLVPVVAALAGWIILGEAISVVQGLGATLIIGGVVLARR